MNVPSEDRLKRKAKDGDDAIHGFVLPSHGAASIRRVVPKARACRMETGAVLLHNGARHDVLARCKREEVRKAR